MAKKKAHHEEHVDEAWLLPYADMLTLLLALFIVMFAMSQVDSKKMEALSQQFNIIFQGGTGIIETGGPAVVPKPSTAIQASATDAIQEAQILSELKSAIDQKIKENGLSGRINADLSKEGLLISMQAAVLFNSGEAVVLPSVQPLLMEISKVLQPLDNHVRIAGHTDNVPINTRQFRSNWDLSAMRAINVMNYMVDYGGLQPAKMSIQAYGEYLPKADNATQEGRALNRRIEILVISNTPQKP